MADRKETAFAVGVCADIHLREFVYQNVIEISLSLSVRQCHTFGKIPFLNLNSLSAFVLIVFDEA
jgi:hypothetical protein